MAFNTPCPECGSPLEGRDVRVQSGWERAGCMGCGLQLVRRVGEGDWTEIRG